MLVLLMLRGTAEDWAIIWVVFSMELYLPLFPHISDSFSSHTEVLSPAHTDMRCKCCILSSAIACCLILMVGRWLGSLQTSEMQP